MEKDGIVAEPVMRRVRDPVTGESVLVEDMSYREWENLKKSVTKPSERGIINKNRPMAGGLRRSPDRIITETEIDSLLEDARSIGADLSVFRFNTGSRTGFDDATGLINIRGDVFPDMTAISSRDTMSSKAVLAHEYYGHYKYAPSNFKVGDWRDEMRASYSAAMNAPGLSREERVSLLVDAYDRAREAGHNIEYSKKVKEIIYGY